jgi:hypothetical protein
MADAQLSVTRRALLAGVPLFPLILSGAEPGRSARSKDAPLVKGEGARSWPNFRLTFDPSPPARPGPWVRALDRFRATEAALAAAAHTADEDLYDRLGARHERALQRLLRTPAPHLAALAAKLDLALDDRAGEFIGNAAAMKALKQDARRLAASSV